MKQSAFFLLLLSLFAATGCDKDHISFYVDNFTVNDQFVDASGDYTPDAVLRFDIAFRSDDPDDGDYSIESFDFTYRVNGTQSFVIQSDSHMGVDAFSVKATVDLLNLKLPDEFCCELIPGDEVEFRIVATDSCGDTLERTYLVRIK